MKKTLQISSLLIGFIWSFGTLAKDLTVVSFGGAYGAAQQKHMVNPYMAATGKNVLFEDYSGGVAELKAQVDSGNVSWDVLDIEYVDLERACSEGMLELLPLNTLPNGNDGSKASDDFYDGALHECAVGVIYWTIVVAHKNNLATKPSSIADFFNTAKIPGKRAMRKRPQVNLEWALLADGVAKKDVYKVLSTDAGVTRAFAKLDTIKKDIVWFDSWSQVPQMLNDDSVTLAQVANGRIYGAIQEGSPFEISWADNIFDLDGLAIPKGSKNKEQALNFIRFASMSIPLSGMQDVAYGSSRKSSSSYLSDKVAPHLPSAHLDKGMKADGIFWADNGAALTERFTAWSIK